MNALAGLVSGAVSEQAGSGIPFLIRLAFVLVSTNVLAKPKPRGTGQTRAKANQSGVHKAAAAASLTEASGG